MAKGKISAGTQYVALQSNGTHHTFNTIQELKAFLLTEASQFVQKVYSATELKFERIEDVKIS